MKSILFTFNEGASDETQNHTGDQLLKLPGVQNVGRISPTAKKPELRRLWYAEVDDVAAPELVTRLRDLDEIQSADLPAERS
jgi:hypothetical protein